MEKKNLFQKMNRNQKGFSLVEVLIAMSILSIVAVMAFGFMSSSSKLFSKTNAEVSIQTEAQSAANAIKDLIMDCQVSVAYFDTKTDPANVFVDNGVTYENALLINNNNEQFLVYQNPAKADELLYLSRVRNASTQQFDIPFNPSDAEVLAEYISDFKVDTSRFDDTKIVDFAFTYALRGKEYAGTYQVRMRNDIIISSETDYEITDGDRVTQVFVTPATYTVTPDTTASPDIIAPQKFTAVVRTSGTMDTSKTWSLSHVVPGCAVDVDGELSFTQEPTLDSFKVIATSNADPDKSGSASIKVKKLTNLSVMAVSGVTGVVEGVESANLNSKVLFAGLVEGWNLTSADQSVTWKLEYKPHYGTSGEYTVLTYYDPARRQYVNTKENIGFINAGGLLQIGKDATSSVEFRITATANFPNYGKPVTYESRSTLLRVKNVDVDFDGNFIRDYKINLKNYFLSGKAAIDGSIATDITEINSYDSASYESGAAVKNLIVDTAMLANGILVVDSSSVNYSSAEENKKYYDSLNVIVTVRDQNNEARQFRVTLPKVSVSKGEPTSNYIVVRKGSTIDIPFTYSGINITKADQIGIYIDGEKVSGSGSGSVNEYLISYLQTNKEDGSSALGTIDEYINTQTVRLAASTTSNHYPTEKSNLIISIDDYYQASGKAAGSYIEYDVYVANVEGQNLYIPVPGAAGFPSSISTSSSNPSSHKLGPDETTVSLYRNGANTYMKYSAKTYVYDSAHSYWKIK